MVRGPNDVSKGQTTTRRLNSNASFELRRSRLKGCSTILMQAVILGKVSEDEAEAMINQDLDEEEAEDIHDICEDVRAVRKKVINQVTLKSGR